MKRFHPCLAVMPFLGLPLLTLSGCATVGSMMSPYGEKFSCKNSDHGQCIHPDQAYADAVAGRASKSDPSVTHDRKLLSPDQKGRAPVPGKGSAKAAAVAMSPQAGQSNVGAVLEGAGSPMLRPSRTIRTLILPYADKQRPDRLYMARYVYSILNRPAWVVGDYLVEPGGRSPAPPVLRTMRAPEPDTADGTTAEDVPMAIATEKRP
ncbi:putative exported protein [Sphingobium sp. SYK-6]|nr:putative exported protein [Sphingobium sp. SYK-6]